MSQSKNEVNVGNPKSELPIDGFSRWGDIKHIVPVSKEKWRQLSRDGFAPPIIRFTARCSFQKNGEILRWLSDPLSYRVNKEGVDTLPEGLGQA